ncbi:Gvp36 protein [Martiniozyma asiatica (nom. inval.)]|nr:Gvp36 protein [Martiniozyma asiatica]
MSFFQSLQQQLQETTQNLGSQLNSLSLQETAAHLTTSMQENLNQLSGEVNNLKPIFQRTTRSLQEKFGSIDDISELPQDYKDLEKQVDNLKLFYQNVLNITSQYEIESYDFPPNLKESLSDYSSLLSEKISGLSQASTAQEAERVLLSGRKDKIPKTLHHQLGKTLNGCKDSIIANKAVSFIPGVKPKDEEGSEIKENALTIALGKISDSQFKIGNERLEQDKLIIVEFNAKVKNLLKSDFVKVLQLRKDVENARLSFDTVRAEIKSLQKGDPEAPVPEDVNAKLEGFEDELVNATEVAVEMMKDLIKPYEGVNLLKVFCKIQLNYHKNVVRELEACVDDLEAIQFDNEEE